jgi:hypothetical protein
MTTFFRTSTFVFASLLTFGAAASARADIHDLDRLAVRLEGEARTLFQELRFEVNDRNLQVASGEVLQLQRRASRIHAMIHRGYGLSVMHAEVLAVQDMIDHVHEHLAGYRHYDRHVHRMEAFAAAMDEALHEAAHDHYPVRQPVYQPVYPSYGGYGHGYNGVTVGNGGFQIRIGR